MGTWYRTGTVSVTNGSPDIVGVGTLWLTQASVGDIFLAPNLVEHEITAITDDTHLAVKQVNGTAAYAGTTASAQPYAIIRNFTSTIPAQLASQLAALMTTYHVTLDELTAWLSGTGTVTVHDAVGNSYSVQTPAAMNATLTGRLVKSVAGSGDITLTSGEASNLFHELTGTRTAIGNYIVPASARHYFIFNNTAYAMTVKTPAGSGIAVGAGVRMLLLCNGTNVVEVCRSVSGCFGVGGVVPAASGAGMTFPAVQTPSSDANTLDDYEEGTFLPVVAGLTSAGAGTYNSQQGRYTKIGREVYFRIYLNVTAHTGTGEMVIEGLPFAAAAVPARVSASAWNGTLTLTGGSALQAVIYGSESRIRLSGSGATGSVVQLVETDGVFTLAVSGSYHID